MKLEIKLCLVSTKILSKVSRVFESTFETLAVYYESSCLPPPRTIANLNTNRYGLSSLSNSVKHFVPKLNISYVFPLIPIFKTNDRIFIFVFTWHCYTRYNTRQCQRSLAFETYSFYTLITPSITVYPCALFYNSKKEVVFNGDKSLDFYQNIIVISNNTNICFLLRHLTDYNTVVLLQTI